MNLAQLSPTRLALLLTAVKSFSAVGPIGDAGWNERGLHARRVQLACAFNRVRRARLRGLLSVELRARFDREGFVILPDFLPQPLFTALRQQVRALDTSVRERTEGSTLLSKIPIDAGVLRAVPALQQLRVDPRFVGLMAYGEGNRRPPLLFLQAVKQRPDLSAQDPQCDLHRDTFHPTVKAWLYLNDVAEQAGPLVYVPGSHRLDAARLAWEREKSIIATRDPHQRQSSFRIDERELSALGCAAPCRLPVAANTLIVADTFGFHARGRSQRRSLRLEVWATGNRSPFLSYELDRALQQLTRSAHRVNWRTRAGSSDFDADA